MGLFSGIKRQLLKVIEWKDDSKNTIVYRYPLSDRDEIMTSSTLVVRESQYAVFVHKGEIADIFGPGTHTLETGNIPFLTKMLSLPQGFESKIKAEVYFVNSKQFTGLKWGTQNPIMMRDKEFGNVRLRGYGVYSFRVEDPRAFMKEMFGTNALYTVDDVATQCKPMLIQSITDAIAESKISALDLAANYKEFSEAVIKASQKEFSAFGLKLCTVVFENISLPEEVEQMLDERTKMGVMEDKMGTYTQFQAAQAMRDAAKNTSGGNLAGLGVGLGAGGAVGKMFSESLSTENKPKAKMTECTECGASIPENSKFCPECGKKQGLTCPKCGASLKKGAKFCSECGEPLTKAEKTCECGAKLSADAKFCPECGKSVK